MSEQAGPDRAAAGWRVLTRNSAGDLVWQDVSFEAAALYAMNDPNWRLAQQPASSGFAGWWRKLFG